MEHITMTMCKINCTLILLCVVALHGFSNGLPTPNEPSGKNDTNNLQVKVDPEPMREAKIHQRTSLDLGPSHGGRMDPKPIQTRNEKDKDWAKGTNMGENIGHKTRSSNTSLPVMSCDINIMNPDIYDEISTLVNDGAKLVEYNLNFPEYNENPLLVNMSNNYMSNRWARAYTTHGKSLLALSFNYDILSLSMLSFGVEKMDIDIIDTPEGCFGILNATDKLDKIMKIVMADFSLEHKEYEWVGEFDYACHQVITDDNGIANLQYRCCDRSLEGDHIYCTKHTSVKWLSVLYVPVVILKVVVFLIGPVFLHRIVYSESLRQAYYIVKLKDKMRKTIFVQKVEETIDNSVPESNEAKEFCAFKKVMKNVTFEGKKYVEFKKLQLKIDQRKMMTERSVPVGLWLFIYKNFFKCLCLRWEPFGSCCKQSIFRSWPEKFLWLDLRDPCNHESSEHEPLSETSNSKPLDCETLKGKKNVGICTWSQIFTLLGGLLLLLAVPIPYYIRVAIYYIYEEQEIISRKAAIKELKLEYPFEHTLIHYIDPKHTVMILMYITYGLSLVLLVALRAWKPREVDSVAVGAVHDMRQLHRKECFRLILAHFVLPFEKFGICGAIVGAIYWPIILPICAALTLFYCIPTFYLLGRFIIHARLSCLKKRPSSTPQVTRKSKKAATLSHETTSFETCLFLERISPTSSQTMDDGFSTSTQECFTSSLSVMVGLLCSVLMLSVLILFADVLGFAVEVCVFTLMGTIVNASNAVKYIMLAFWIMAYSSSCFNNVYEKYLDLNVKLFDFIKVQLKDEINEVTVLRDEKQKNTAFKFFNEKDLATLQKLENEEEINSDIETEEELDIKKYYHDVSNIENDKLEYVNGRLHWLVHSLILFIDSGDEPRIPKDLFNEICKIDAPGCPGPIHRSILRAFRQLAYMVVFIVFVLITVMAFGDAYKISTTNQMLVTLAGGFLPFVIRFVIKPKSYSVDLNTYSFDGKIHQVIYNFKQQWPIYDLSFKVSSTQDAAEGSPAEDDTGNVGQYGVNPKAMSAIETNDGKGEYKNNNPNDIDLFITVRADKDNDIHIEPGGPNPQGSHNSAHTAGHKNQDDLMPYGKNFEGLIPFIDDENHSVYDNLLSQEHDPADRNIRRQVEDIIKILSGKGHVVDT